jgi:hypothetical protein
MNSLQGRFGYFLHRLAKFADGTECSQSALAFGGHGDGRTGAKRRLFAPLDGDAAANGFHGTLHGVGTTLRYVPRASWT